jgi:hypothetical protein
LAKKLQNQKPDPHRSEDIGALVALNGGVEGIVVDPDSLNPAFKT